jgi:hypothetical protein
MAGIVNADAATVLFAGQSDLVVFDVFKGDYSTAKVADLLKGGQSLGQISEESTSWTGDDPTIDVLYDEQHQIIGITPKPGTQSFEAEAASTSNNMLKLLHNGKEIKIAKTDLTDADVEAEADVTAIGIGGELPMSERPIAWWNQEKTRMFFMPKATIVGSFTQNGRFVVNKISVTAGYVDTDDLQPLMVIDLPPKYATKTVEG